MTMTEAAVGTLTSFLSASQGTMDIIMVLVVAATDPLRLIITPTRTARTM
jgi:hypothetical protein